MLRLKKFGFARFVLLFAIALFPLASPADTTVLPSAVSGVGWQCSAFGAAKGKSAQSVPLEASGACDVAGANHYGTAMAAGTAYTHFGASPSASVSALASQSAITNNLSGASIDMLAEVIYNIAVVENGAPPESPDFVPVTETWQGEATPNSFLSGAEACVEFGPSGWNCTASGSANLLLAPDVAYTVGIKADCNAFSVGDGVNALNGGCQAVIDPTFSFDQATFDATQGAHSFNLASYYSFAYSPNLTAGAGLSVPEPNGVALLGLGIFGVALSRRAKAT